MKVEQDSIFTGANKQNYICDYNSINNIIAYGAGNNVALWNPIDINQKGVYHTLKKHTKEITTVKFLPNSPFLISTSEDRTINIWKQSNNDLYTHFQTLSNHENSITCIAVCENFFISGSADSQIIIWINKDGEFSISTQFQIKSNFYPLCLAIQKLDTENYILAIGGTTNNLYIYTFNISNLKIEKVSELTGHEDWIKCLQFVKESQGNYILASASQDRYVRLWRLKLNELIDDSDEDSTKLTLLSNKQYKFNYGNQLRGCFSLEALIMGHDDWINGIQWHPSYNYNTNEKKLQLLTCTADTSLFIWEMDLDSGIWVCVNRLGEMSIKGASTATGSSGGFWSCLWFIYNNEQYIIASGKTGSFRVYKSKTDSLNFDNVLGITGPTREVTDVAWSKTGDYFVATSLDQTTRLFAPWKRDNIITWHEIARPQIHGYDMICYDNITTTKFVSGGDEKILRVFEITNSISSLLKKISNIDIKTENGEVLPESASLPVLGLSNKVESQLTEGGGEGRREEIETQEDEKEEEIEDPLSGLTSPPIEEYLQRFTLFPEIEKLYGHGYEISCCSTSPNGKHIASACKSNNFKHAVIRIFNVTKDYQQLTQVLQGHNLTISSLKWSCDGKYLLSVSRDRQFTLWKLINDEEFKLIELNSKAHTRILWDCDWIADKHEFITVSRDKTMKLWRIKEDETGTDLISSIKLEEPITSVSVYKGDCSIIAIGLENGDIQLFKLMENNDEFKLLHKLDNSITPSDRIEKLSFSSNKTENGCLWLSVGSKDNSLRLYNICV
ncbi:unnamed protein product [Candida verbasci]|uniref:Elongator complex protein 2 n=1 Tax=Candida verbasci TaxID=1227364 RepID=A0A9W4TXW6_9ASCO|nr:unnamed protein product [Candida verbasci]